MPKVTIKETLNTGDKVYFPGTVEVSDKEAEGIKTAQSAQPAQSNQPAAEAESKTTEQPKTGK